jgi:hypothetical protein
VVKREGLSDSDAECSLAVVSSGDPSSECGGGSRNSSNGDGGNEKLNKDSEAISNNAIGSQGSNNNSAIASQDFHKSSHPSSEIAPGVQTLKVQSNLLLGVQVGFGVLCMVFVGYHAGVKLLREVGGIG